MIPWAREHGTGVIAYSPMAPGCSPAAFDRERSRGSRRATGAAGRPPFSEPALGAKPRRSSSGCGRSPADSGTTVPALAVAWVLAQAGRDRARSSARACRGTSTAGRGRPSSSSTAQVLAEIDDAVTASGAGTDEPPQPPPHVACCCGSANGGRMRLGIVSTADINREGDPGRARVREGRARRRREPRPGARRGVREAVGDRASVRLVRGAARRPGRRRRLHLPPEHDAPRVVDPLARGRQARHLREAVQPAAGGRGGGVRRRRAGGSPADRGVHVPAQPADRKARRARPRAAPSASSASSARRSATPSTTRRTSASAPTSTAAASWTSAATASAAHASSAGEPDSVSGQAYIGPSGTDWVFTGAMRFPGDVHALFDCGTCLPNRDELEAIGTEGSLFLDDPWHCNVPVIEIRRGRRRSSAIELEPSTRTGSSSRTSPTRSPARRRCCSVARTRSARRGRSKRSSARPRAARRRGGGVLTRDLEVAVHRARVRVALEVVRARLQGHRPRVGPGAADVGHLVDARAR